MSDEALAAISTHHITMLRISACPKLVMVFPDAGCQSCQIESSEGRRGNSKFHTVSVPVTLTVWNFELPLRPSELSIWQLWQPASGNTITSLGQALMRNMVMWWVDMAANASSDMTTVGLNRSGLDYYYSIGIRCDGSYVSLPSTSQISAAAANFPTGLPLDLYLADELNGCPNAYTPLKAVATNAHAASGGVKTIMTINTPDPNLFNEGDGRSAIDHWVLLDSLEQWPALPFTGGGDLWSYTS